MPQKMLARVNDIASKQSATVPAIANEHLIAACIDYLNSKNALDLLATDPYWPKWNGPWWQMMLLYETGNTSLIPKNLVDLILNFLDNYYVHHFPLTEQELPDAAEPVNHIICHCQLGSIHKLLTAYGVNVYERFPWVWAWYLKYQLGDGGFNCDEQAYLKENKKSSMVSTLPCLEAVLSSAGQSPSAEEVRLLDAGANYVFRRKLFRRVTTDEVIDSSWLRLSFPRYYHYDVLRGLNFVLSWSSTLNKPLPYSSIHETVSAISDRFDDGLLCVERSVINNTSTRIFDDTRHEWTRQPAGSFPLLDHVSAVGSISPYLIRQWEHAKKDLLLVMEKGLLQFDD